MKPIVKIFFALFIFSLTNCIAPQKAAAQSVSVQVFYDELSPYGTWVENPNYGYVWVPNVDPGFEPYATNGHWVYTDYGWTWVSDYAWGWAPFHYGRWYNDPSYGEIWVPDNEWAPAWVTWRRSDGYYGWCAMGPGVSVSASYASGYNVPAERWTFVRNGDFGRENINRYYVNHGENATIIKNTTVIQNVRIDNSRHETYIGGPDKNEVQKFTKAPVKTVTVAANTKPGQNYSNGQLKIYKPQVQKSNSAGQKPVPPKVASLKEVKPAAERKSGMNPGATTPANNKANTQPRVNTPGNTKQQPANNNRPVSTQQHNTAPVNKAQQQPNRANPAANKQVAPQRNNAPAVTRDPKQQADRPNPAANRQAPQPTKTHPPVNPGQPKPDRAVPPPNSNNRPVPTQQHNPPPQNRQQPAQQPAHNNPPPQNRQQAPQQQPAHNNPPPQNNRQQAPPQQPVHNNPPPQQQAPPQQQPHNNPPPKTGGEQQHGPPPGEPHNERPH